MLDLTGVSYSTSEQNKDISESRKNRDMKDTKTLLNALAEQNKFTAQKGLRNIMNGVHANDTVNVDDAKDIGQGILASIDWNVCHGICLKTKQSGCDSCYKVIS